MTTACEFCGGSMLGKRSNAVYCSRSCKTRASDARRVDDGRSVARDRARYPREAEKRRACAMKYLLDNQEKMRAIRRARRSRIRYDRRVFTERDWRRMVTRYRGCCAYCNQKSDVLHREHVIPLARGGRHSVGNIVPACPSCNYRKKTKLPVEFRLSVGGR